MQVRKIVAVAGATFALARFAPPSHAAILVVDDDQVECSQAAYTTIGAALAAAKVNDLISVCPGTYAEQLVIDTPVRIIGEPHGGPLPVIRPTDLSAAPTSLLGDKPIAAGIIANAYAVIDSVEVDMSGNTLSECVLMAGIYFRNASGIVRNARVRNAGIPSLPTCDTGVGLYVESGRVEFGGLGDSSGFGRAKVSVRDTEFIDNQKGGIVANGEGTVLRVRGGEIAGSGSATGAVENGVQFGVGARGRLVEASVRNQATLTAGKMASGILLYRSGKVTLRRLAINDTQTGLFASESRVRLLGSEFTNMLSDGVLLLGDRSTLSGNIFAGAVTSGIFVSGERNLIRGGSLSNMPVGCWFYAGETNAYAGLTFTDVPVEGQAVYGGIREVSRANAAPFLPGCLNHEDCDDGMACTADLCDGTTGKCLHTDTCDDQNACTDDSCSASGCVMVPNTGPCDDGNACTVNDVCSNGTCAAGLPAVCDDTLTCTFDACSPTVGCVHLSACDDHNPCTDDTCDEVTGCTNTVSPDGTSCPDNNPCNGTEVCQAGVCNPGLPPNCDDSNPCTGDTCDLDDGCTHTPLTNNTPCPDGDACNGAETCQAGQCATAPPPNCDDGNICTTDGCNAVSGCSNTPISGCQACTGDPDCNDNNPCTVDVCNAGTCENTSVVDSTPCADADACNGTETCVAGSCTPGTPPNCDDGNVCTSNSCDPVAGCQNPPIADGTSCTDGDVCNGAEACQAGVCAPGTPLVCDDGNPCTADSCLPVSGCQTTPVGNGTPCPDGDVCNGNETCVVGACAPGTPLSCNDGNPCTADACDPLAGCQAPPVTDGTPCPDADLCNGQETCQAGTCTPGMPAQCNDNNPCTTDPCDPDLGCQNIPVGDGTPCPDGDVCNGNETCQAGTCTPSGPLGCDDGNECTTDSCDALGGCQHTDVSDGSPCSTGTCQGGVCT